jgi:outer membrane protein assembly factor BamD (BamD/ComL family)
VKSWNEFLHAHADSPRAALARENGRRSTERERLAEEEEQERSARTIALRLSTEESLRNFLEGFPASPAAAEMRQRIATFEAVRLDAAWEAALKENTPAAWESFIARHPGWWEEPAQERLRRATEAARRESEGRARTIATNEGEDAERPPTDRPPSPPPAFALEEQPLAEEEESEAWRYADHLDSKQAFDAFLREFPHSPHAAEARQRVAALSEAADDRSWETAQASKAYEWFARTYPLSPHAAEARQMVEAMETEREARRDRWLDEKAWTAAKNLGTREAFEHFIEQHPKSPFVSEAIRALEDIETRERHLRLLHQEETAWEEARRAGTESVLRSFLRRYPQSAHAATAHEQLRNIEEGDQAWQRAKDLGTVDAVDEFMQRHPTSHVAGARQRRKTLEKKQKRDAELQAAEAGRAALRRQRQGQARRGLAALSIDEPVVGPAEQAMPGPSIGFTSIGLIVFGVLVMLLGISVLVRKGPQGLLEVAVGMLIVGLVIFVSRKRLSRNAIAWAAAGLVATALIAYDLSQLPHTGAGDRDVGHTTTTTESNAAP